MELAELIIFIALCFGLYKAFAPLQRHLERFLLRWFRKGPKSGHAQKPIIDITDYSKHSGEKKDN